MDDREYLNTVAVPLLTRLVKEPSAQELQIAAVICTFHVADYIAATKQKSISEIRESLEELAPEFRAIHASANASKHHTISRSPAAERGLSETHAETEIKWTYDGKPLQWLHEGTPLKWIDYEIVLRDGTRFPLIGALQSVLNACNELVGGSPDDVAKTRSEIVTRA